MNFLEETLKRFFSKNPSYFKWINIILNLCILITGIPSILEQFGISVPAGLQTVYAKVILIATLLGRFLTQLPTTEKSITAKDNNV